MSIGPGDPLWAYSHVMADQTACRLVDRYGPGPLWAIYRQLEAELGHEPDPRRIDWAALAPYVAAAAEAEAAKQ